MRWQPGTGSRRLAAIGCSVSAPWSRSWVRPKFGRCSTRPARPIWPTCRYGPFDRNVLDVWKAPAGQVDRRPLLSAGGLLPRRRLHRRRQVERAGVAGGEVPGRGDLGRLGELSAVDPVPVPGPDARRRPGDPVPSSQGEGAGHRPATGSPPAATRRVRGSALWAGFHDDLADPGSADPVLRQSSRLACMGVVGAQTSYDPRFIKQTIGGRAHEHIALRPLFGIHSDAEADIAADPEALRGSLTPHLRLGRRSPRDPLLLRARRPAPPTPAPARASTTPASAPP